MSQTKEVAYKFRGTTHNGELHMRDLKAFNKQLADMGDSNVFVTIHADDGEATLEHRAYYFKVIVRNTIKMSETFGGWTEDDLHDHFKEHAKIESTKGFKKKQMNDFINKIKDYLAITHDIHHEGIDNYKEV